MPDLRRAAHLGGVGLGHLLHALGSDPLMLSAGDLIDRAQRSAGHGRWAEPDPQEALSLLVEDLNSRAHLHLPGRLAASYDLLRMLAHRLQIDRTLENHPTIRNLPVTAPLFIIGLPRTGTTILHDLLAQDPGHRAPLTWELLYPVSGFADPAADRLNRRKKAMAKLPWMEAMSPGFLAAHPLGADDPQECVSIKAHTMHSLQFQSMYHVPRYQQWLESRPKAPVYAFHRRFLQYLQLSSPGRHDGSRRWVLKAPAHLFGLDALLETYPDALIVQTHREPQEVMSSLASLAVRTRAAFSARVDPHAVGREMYCRWSSALDTALEARDRVLGKPNQFFDVNYQSFVADPLAVMKQLYRHFQLPWSDTLERRFVIALRQRRQYRHGIHHHQLEDFGLVAEEIDERLSGYRRRFL